EGERHGERRVRCDRRYDASQWLLGEDPVCSAQHGLPASRQVPCKADARLKVLIVLVVDLIDMCAGAQERNGPWVEDNEAAVPLSGRHIPVITQAELYGQVRPQQEAVLHEETERFLVNAARLIAE